MKDEFQKGYDRGVYDCSRQIEGRRVRLFWFMVCLIIILVIIKLINI
jgi:hypothetical protein